LIPLENPNQEDKEKGRTVGHRDTHRLL